MAKKFNELRARMSPKARAQAETMTKKLLDEMQRKNHGKCLGLRNGK